LGLLLAAFPAVAESAAGPAPSPPAPASDSVREVRRFPPIEVSAGRVHDLRSNATVHSVSGEALRALPLSSLAQALALQPGVVAVGDEVHVRGDRAGETQWTLGGLVLNEPLRDRAPELPLLAIQRADLLAGGLDAEYAGALAGVLDVRTANPSPGPDGGFRWLSSGRLGTAYDWLGVRGSLPLPVAGLGLVAAARARVPALRAGRALALLRARPPASGARAPRRQPAARLQPAAAREPGARAGRARHLPGGPQAPLR
jgi:outer membrane receptor protein involved in Fe transport